ncbi:hypothetical protein AGABI1DRAFT_127674 [Agaricus bisporus var. burnettii JB137-S8]|uniref:DASH complex subunit SPC19 n=2 Tax=Agaricus bisporus var. burnettii TaxID=192524 RepID=K5XAA2_AGABU|nr:uncharacterized protein AGABI1DRAFT_127674 [Agaricus bisporus var. burnettii JB137-S8]EKM79992.1 hypothetical protein AGABI1DRAFT_127674 [Agaricus bisporus var. burnettii JB137-S8]KAF7775826.1 hypothetical protein Agabi119p4_4219 [Agaricus bisporus var. burnettii]
MSRLSKANLRARESIFASGPNFYRSETLALCPPDLEECVAAMEDCCEEAHEAQQLLRSGTQDLPRMTKVLENERVFLLVNEDTIKRYKNDLADEVEPTINELIGRAEQGLAALEKKEASLKTKLEAAQAHPNRAAMGATATQKMEARRLQLLIKQRERLENDVRALDEEIILLEAKTTKRKKL